MDRSDEEITEPSLDFDFKDLVDVVFHYAAFKATRDELTYFKTRIKQVLPTGRGETELRSQHKDRLTRRAIRRQNGS